jgi:hypothetical protein
MDLDSPAAFFRRLVARQKTAADQDPANMGTAFGLEASLGPVSAHFNPDGQPAIAGSNPGADDAPMNWLARRLRRPR